MTDHTQSASTKMAAQHSAAATSSSDVTPLVDVHAHFTTPDYIEAAKATGHREPDGMPEEYWPSWSAEEHLKLMAETGIGRSMLSISSPGIHFGDDKAAQVLARQVNEAGAEVVRADASHFGLFASLPLPDVDGSLHEIAYAFDDLGADGVILMSNAHGYYLGSERAEPILEELHHRQAAVFIHPTSTQDHQYVDCGRPRTLIEFLFDTARTVVDFVLTGHAERYRDIKLIVPHAGGVVPLVADRVEAFKLISPDTASRPVPEILGRFYYDLAVNATPRNVAALLSLVGREQLLYGSDFPWAPSPLVLRTAASLDSTFESLTQSWRTLTTDNATTIFAKD